MKFFGIELIGFNADNGRKLLLTLVAIGIILLVGYLVRSVTDAIFSAKSQERTKFWTQQGVGLFTTLLLLIAVVSIWFDDPTRLTTAIGLISAGLAFALQKVVTSVAGYFVILRGKNFTIGDRISMGGVRGDVIGLGFIQTTIMEMGQPPAVQNADPAMWVKSRQFTGRIVTVANSKIFDEPVFNYTRDFPFIWEEITIPITYQDKRKEAEAIMLKAANNYVLQINELSAAAVKKLENEYFVDVNDFEPRVFYRITDNWLELTVRFIVSEHKVRDIKDSISREMLAGFDKEGIGIASATYDIVGFPPLRIEGSSLGGNAPNGNAPSTAKNSGV